MDMAFFVKNVASGSVAEAAGLLDGDIILRTDGLELQSVQELTDHMQENGVAKLEYVRGDDLHQVKVEGIKLGLTLIPGEYLASADQCAALSRFRPWKTKDHQYQTRYSLNRLASGISFFAGLAVVIWGVSVLFVGDELAQAATLTVSGLAIMQISQIGKAVTDTADHTREIMNILSRKQ